MAKPNYSYEKRQRELAKKKKEEKLQRKAESISRQSQDLPLEEQTPEPAGDIEKVHA